MQEMQINIAGSKEKRGNEIYPQTTTLDAEAKLNPPGRKDLRGGADSAAETHPEPRRGCLCHIASHPTGATAETGTVHPCVLTLLHGVCMRASPL